MFDMIIFDWKRTLYDPDRKVLLPGAVELLKFLRSKHIPMILIGKGGQDMKQEVKRLGVAKYFQEIVFSDKEKDLQTFQKFIKNPQEVLVIGDRVRSELEIGKKLGAVTIWVRQGKFVNELPENPNQKPDYIVANLDKLAVLFKTHLFAPRDRVFGPI
ncbi:MAG: HAD hydrolase-like protein [Candidatus Daviesbacteria bacterium]|nr:HAD hydrolase-like protein [Candidatus Daviesbacteria bacterium]